MIYERLFRKWLWRLTQVCAPVVFAALAPPPSPACAQRGPVPAEAPPSTKAARSSTAKGVAEKSLDARKVLGQMGIPFTEQAFWESLGDLRSDVVQLFLDAGMSADARRAAPQNDTPLLLVTSSGCASVDVQQKAAANKIALALIAHGADVNAKGDYEVTPLLHAAGACVPEVVAALVQAGADMRARARGGLTALASAAMSKRADNVRILIEAGYDVKNEPGEMASLEASTPEIEQVLRHGRAAAVTPEPVVNWNSLAVQARVDGNGVIHAKERFVLVVEGDLSRIKREYRIYPGRVFRLDGIGRLDSRTGALQPLMPGDLDEPDHYQLNEWLELALSLRGKQAPPFAPGTTLTYESTYTVSGAVIPVWGMRTIARATMLNPYAGNPLLRWRELASVWKQAGSNPDRRCFVDFDFLPWYGEKPIGTFTIDLAVDPIWRPVGSTSVRWSNVPASDEFREGFVLDYTGPGYPAGVDRQTPLLVYVAFGALPVVSLLLWFAFIARYWARSRQFASITVEEAWLATEVLNRPPREITAALLATGGPQAPLASALLAQMEREGKVEIDDRANPRLLRLHADRAGLRECERALVDVVFGNGSKALADEVRRRYDAGIDFNKIVRDAFDRSKVVKRALLRDLRAGVPSMILLGTGVALLIYSAFSGLPVPLFAAVVGGALGFSLFSWVARILRDELNPPLALLFLLLMPVLFYSIGAAVLFLVVPPFPLAAVGVALFAIGCTNMLLNAAKFKGGEDKREWLYKLGLARDHFKAELHKRYPDLNDTWLPWIAAMGLDGEVKKWRRRAAKQLTEPPEVSNNMGAMGRWSGGTGGPSDQAWAEKFLCDEVE
jgi:hypothetical protein